MQTILHFRGQALTQFVIIASMLLWALAYLSQIMS